MACANASGRHRMLLPTDAAPAAGNYLNDEANGSSSSSSGYGRSTLLSYLKIGTVGITAGSVVLLGTLNQIVGKIRAKTLGNFDYLVGFSNACVYAIVYCTAMAILYYFKWIPRKNLEFIWPALRRRSPHAAASSAAAAAENAERPHTLRAPLLPQENHQNHSIECSTITRAPPPFQTGSSSCLATHSPQQRRQAEEQGADSSLFSDAAIEERPGGWRLLALVGLFDSCANIMGFVAQPLVPGPLFVVSLQAIVPFSCLCSLLLLKRRYSFPQLTALGMVVFGVLFPLINQFDLHHPSIDRSLTTATTDARTPDSFVGFLPYAPRSEFPPCAAAGSAGPSAPILADEFLGAAIDAPSSRPPSAGVREQAMTAVGERPIASSTSSTRVAVLREALTNSAHQTFRVVSSSAAADATAAANVTAFADESDAAAAGSEKINLHYVVEPSAVTIAAVATNQVVATSDADNSADAAFDPGSTTNAAAEGDGAAVKATAVFGSAGGAANADAKMLSQASADLRYSSAPLNTADRLLVQQSSKTSSSISSSFSSWRAGSFSRSRASSHSRESGGSRVRSSSKSEIENYEEVMQDRTTAQPVIAVSVSHPVERSQSSVAKAAADLVVPSATAATVTETPGREKTERGSTNDEKLQWLYMFVAALSTLPTAISFALKEKLLRQYELQEAETSSAEMAAVAARARQRMQSLVPVLAVGVATLVTNDSSTAAARAADNADDDDDDDDADADSNLNGKEIESEQSSGASPRVILMLPSDTTVAATTKQSADSLAIAQQPQKYQLQHKQQREAPIPKAGRSTSGNQGESHCVQTNTCCGNPILNTTTRVHQEPSNVVASYGRTGQMNTCMLAFSASARNALQLEGATTPPAAADQGSACLKGKQERCKEVMYGSDLETEQDGAEVAALLGGAVLPAAGSAIADAADEQNDSDAAFRDTSIAAPAASATRLHIIVICAHCSAFQVLWAAAGMPLSIYVGQTNHESLINYLTDALHCLAGKPLRSTSSSSNLWFSQSHDDSLCAYAARAYAVYIIINLLFNISLIGFVAIASSLLTFVTIKLTLPASVFLYVLFRWPLLEHEDVRVDAPILISLASILFGVIWFHAETLRYKRIFFNAPTRGNPPCCWPLQSHLLLLMVRRLKGCFSSFFLWCTRRRPRNANTFVEH